MRETLISFLPHWNASLNLVALLLLLWGYRLIRQRRELAHRRVMLAAFAVSSLFLLSYVVYHALMQGGKRFPEYPPPAVRYFYLTVLITHVVLAAAVPVLALVSIYYGLRDKRPAHRRVVRWAFPIWVYVSVTGVIVYLMLYQLYPPRL